MDTNVIWWAAIALEALLLARGMWTGLLRKYPLFYTYIGCVLLKEFIGVLTYQWARGAYEPVYWPAELATIVASYALIIEIFRQVLRDNPGAGRLSQNLLMMVFGLMLIYASYEMLRTGSPSLARAIVELSRDLRDVEGGLLLVMLWLFVRYRISIGKNVLGLILGYAFYIGVNIMNLAAWFVPGNESSVFLRKLLPASYFLTLFIWCVALWAPQRNPVQPTDREVERDYNLLAARTQTILARVYNRSARMKP